MSSENTFSLQHSQCYTDLLCNFQIWSLVSFNGDEFKTITALIKLPSDLSGVVFSNGICVLWYFVTRTCKHKKRLLDVYFVFSPQN